MNPRTQQSVTPRGGLNNNISTPGKSAAGSQSSSRSTTQTTPKLNKSTPLRPNRVNTAVNASPRKVSAPSKLISSVIRGSFDNLPDTVSVRRKASSPARPQSSNSLAAGVTTKKSSTSSCGKVKKSSNTTSSGNTQSVPLTRMSKDNSGGSSTKIATEKDSSAAGSASSGSGSKSGKKASTTVPPPCDAQSLPPLKEEKTNRINKGPRKMSSTAPVLPHDRGGTRRDELHTVPSSSSRMLDDPSPDNAASTSAGVPEKQHLEKVVSDLVKNAESKKQEIAALKMEINRLKEARRDKCHSSDEEQGTSASAAHKEAVNKLEETVNLLSSENKALKEHLQNFGIPLESSPLSDQQKEMILSKVSAISQNGTLDGSGVDRTEWDNKSSSSVSEMSVACLQDRIQQMEETHYCTNEELQATLQELDDLRDQLDDAHQEVQQLQEEKQVILESLTQQTEKLNEARGHNDTLKHMLIQQSENSQDLSQCEKTQRLMELLKSVQEDREMMQMKQEELDQQIVTTKEAEERFHHDSQLIRDRMKTLESMVEAATNEKKMVEMQLAQTTEKLKAADLEGIRLKAAHDLAKEKIVELEAAVISGEKSELADVLDSVRKEKETLEKESSQLQKKMSSVKCENDRLKDQISSLQDDLMVTRNNAKTHMDDVEWRKTQVEDERRRLKEEVETLRASLSDLQLTCQHHLEDKRELKASLCDVQKKLNETLERLADCERSLNEEKSLFKKKEEEWEQFQNDLLTTVRVANDFKTEAQHEREKLEQENVSLVEKLKQFDQDRERAKANKLSNMSNTVSLSASIGSTGLADRRALRSVSSPLANGENPILAADRRNPRPLSRGDSRVKSLIESIESATKQTRAGSRSSSTSSICSTGSESNNNISSSKNNGHLYKRSETDGVIRASTTCTSPLKESGNTLVSSPSSPLKSLQRNSFPEGLTSPYSKHQTGSNLSDSVKMNQLGEKNSVKLNVPNEGITKPMSILTNKMDHNVRRNSYGQQMISVGEKKDPLAQLAFGGGSKRNALLKWCQNKTIGYTNVDITNFSSSWNDGLALCAVLDSYIPEKIDYRLLTPSDKRRNFELAMAAAESVGISTTLDINDMITSERPNWQKVYNYVTSIYTHFET